MSREPASLGRQVGYAAALAVVCAGLLTAANRGLAPYREANERAAEIRDVLAVLDLPAPAGASGEELIARFERSVRRRARGRLTFFEALDDAGAVRAVAVPFRGPGLWGPIHGYLALAPDLATIRGVTFQAPDETPGFGAEIMKPFFRERFAGKRLYGPDGRPAFRVTRGEGPTAVNEVHAVTGATLTSGKVEQILTALAREMARETGQP